MHTKHISMMVLLFLLLISPVAMAEGEIPPAERNGLKIEVALDRPVVLQGQQFTARITLSNVSGADITYAGSRSCYDIRIVDAEGNELKNSFQPDRVIGELLAESIKADEKQNLFFEPLAFGIPMPIGNNKIRVYFRNMPDEKYEVPYNQIWQGQEICAEVPLEIKKPEGDDAKVLEMFSKCFEDDEKPCYIEIYRAYGLLEKALMEYPDSTYAPDFQSVLLGSYVEELLRKRVDTDSWEGGKIFNTRESIETALKKMILQGQTDLDKIRAQKALMLHYFVLGERKNGFEVLKDHLRKFNNSVWCVSCVGFLDSSSGPEIYNMYSGDKQPLTDEEITILANGGDLYRGHGNDPDKVDEDNPGKSGEKKNK